MIRDIVRLLRVCRPYWGWLALGVFLSLISSLANVTLMAVSGWFITAMGLAGVAGASMNYFTPAAIIRACAIVRTGGRYVEQLVTHDATFHVIAGLRRWLFDRLEPLAPAVLGTKRSGDVFARMRGDLDTLERLYLGTLVPLCVGVLGGVIFVSVLALYAPLLALVAGTLMLVTGLILPIIMRISTRGHEHEQIAAQAELRAELSAGLQGMGELLVYDNANMYEQRFETISARWMGAQKALNQSSVFASSLVLLAASLSMGFALYYALQLFEGGALAGADVAMLSFLTLAAFDVITPLPLAVQSLDGVAMAARRIFSLTDQAPPVADPAKPITIPDSFDFDIEFKNVTFAYSENALQPALDDVSFALAAGEKMALIGPTGAGKSTIVNLLCRFWPLQSGQVTIGGESIESFNAADLRQNFAVLPQRPYLFAASIADNLRLADPDASDEAMEEVCRAAGLHDFITAQPDGYDTFVGENGAQLSGGQIRRLALARALLKRAPCLILDEPGEGLDYDTEHDILQRVIGNLNGASLIMITHRKAGLEDMDKVVQFDYFEQNS